MILTIFDKGIPCHTRSYESIPMCHWLGPLQRSAEKRPQDENSESSFPDELCWRFMRRFLRVAVGVKLRTALSRTFPSWQKLQPTLAIESNLATDFWTQFGAPKPFQNLYEIDKKFVFHVSHVANNRNASFLSVTLPGGAKAYRRSFSVTDLESKKRESVSRPMNRDRIPTSSEWFSLSLAKFSLAWLGLSNMLFLLSGRPGQHPFCSQ